MSEQIFTIEKHSTIDKRFPIYGPDDLILYVDFDDVDHDSVEFSVNKAVAILNKHWSEPTDGE